LIFSHYKTHFIYQTCIIHDDLTRCWYTYIPESVVKKPNDNSDEIPIVVDIHGFTGCAYSNSQYTGWADVGKKRKFIIFLPI